MIQTTTAKNACDAVIYLDDDVGNLRDISGSSSQVTPSFSTDIGDARTFGNKWPVRLSCGKDATVSLMVLYSTTDSEGWQIIKDWYFTSHGASRTFGWSMPDGTVGNDRIIGEWLLQDMTWDMVAGVGGPVVVSATLLPDGEITLAAISS